MKECDESEDRNGDGHEEITRKEYERRNTEVMVKIQNIMGDIDKLSLRLVSSEEKIAERSASLNTALDKASVALNSRLDTMNEFRAQINSERALYVTSDKLDLALKVVRAELDGVRQQLTPLKDGQSYNKGRDNTMYTILVGAVAAIALVWELFKSAMGR